MRSGDNGNVGAIRVDQIITRSQFDLRALDESRSRLANAGYGVQIAVHPPSTMIEVPVISELASEARNTTAPITSSSWPIRPS